MRLSAWISPPTDRASSRSTIGMAIVATVIVTTGCGADAPARVEWTANVDTLPTGVVQVMNVPPTGEIEPNWIIEPELRIGAPEGGGPEMFGEVKGIAPLPDGRIAVLDAHAQEIRIFGPDGEHLRTLGGQGSGPGELENANGLLVAPDGLIRVNDPANARLSFFHPDDGFVGSERLEISSYGYIWKAVVDPEGHIHEKAGRFRGDERWTVVKTYDAAGKWTDTTWIAPHEEEDLDSNPGLWRYETEGGYRRVAVPFWPWEANAFDPRGFFWEKAAHTNDYRIVQTTFEGDTVMILESGRPAPPVTTAERDAAIAALREATGGEGFDWSHIPAEKPIVEDLFLDAEGRIWVRVAASDTVTTYDIFGRDGRLKGTAVMTLDLPLSAPIPNPVVVDDRFYALDTDEFNVPYVVQARVRER